MSKLALLNNLAKNIVKPLFYYISNLAHKKCKKLIISKKKIVLE